MAFVSNSGERERRESHYWHQLLVTAVRGVVDKEKKGEETAYSHILRCLTQPGLGKFCERMRKVAQDPATCWHQAHVEPVDGCSVAGCILSCTCLHLLERCSSCLPSSQALSTAFLRPSERRARCQVGANSIPINRRLSLSAACCIKCWSAQHCALDKTLFLFWLNLVTHRNRSECRCDS